jgi:hypothetical protein
VSPRTYRRPPALAESLPRRVTFPHAGPGRSPHPFLRPVRSVRGRNTTARDPSAPGSDPRRSWAGSKLRRGYAPAGGRLTRWLPRAARHRQLVEVRLPEHPARAAVVAWQERDEDEVAPESEAPKQRTARERAWTLALLGSIVSERGRADGKEVVAPVTGDVLDAALAAANDPLG